MPDILDASGLQIATLPEITAALQSGFRAIYGTDINLDSNSPDGQIVGIFAQSSVDIRELLFGIYNSFDPDRAQGAQLDERVTINNIARAGGTYTLIDITLTVTQTVVLQGLDAAFNDINGVGYTVADDSGTQFILVDSITLTAGTYSLGFRAKEIGQVETTIGTINNAVTIVLGVTTINNPSAATNIGQDEETDAQLRLRRQLSVSNASSGYLNGLLGLILSLDGVTDAALYENFTNTTDANSIPPHAIWLIVEGGATSDIGETIYERKSYGCDMRGAVSVDIVTASAGIFIAKFDRPTGHNLYIQFTLKKTNPTQVFDQAVIKQYIVDNLQYKIGQFAETSAVTATAVAAIAAQGGGGVALDTAISSDGITYTDFLNVPTLDSKWTLDITKIAITLT